MPSRRGKSSEEKFRLTQQAAAAEEFIVKKPEPIKIHSPEAKRMQRRLEGRSLISDKKIAQVVEQLVAEHKPLADLLDNPQTAQWLEEFVARVSTGEKSKHTGVFNRVNAFVEGAALPDDIVYTVETMMGQHTKNRYLHKNKTEPVALADVGRKFHFSPDQSKLLFSLIALLEGQYAVSTVVSSVRREQYDHLEKLDVSRAEADAVANIKPLADERQYTKMVEALIKKIGRPMFENMDGGNISHFLGELLLKCRELDQHSFDVILGEGGRKKLLRNIAQKGTQKIDVSLCGAIDRYEGVFGKLTKEELLQSVSGITGKADDWFATQLQKRFGFAQEEVVAPPRVETREPEEKKFEGKTVRIVREEELLRLRAEANRSAEVAQYVFPPTVEKRQLAGKTTPDTPPARMLEGDAPPTLHVPLDREQLVRDYAAAIEAGLSAMRLEQRMPERVQLFLSDVWPQFLLARAQAVHLEGVEKQLTDALALLPSGARGGFEKLVKASGNIEKNEGAIHAAAQELRTNTELHNQGAYVWAEVISRTRSGLGESKSVKILTTQSHELEGVRDMELESGPTRILYAGKRLDRIDHDYPAMGVNVRGDREGVVFLEQVKQHVAHEILPHLTDAAQLVVPEGKEVHPLHALMQRALRAEHGEGRRADVAGAYKRAVWSTTVHEARHEDDRRKGLEVSPSDMEFTAYLTSIATPGEDGKLNQPLTDFISVLDLYRENVAGLGRLTDMFGVYEKATERIILAMAQKLGLEQAVTEELLRNNHLDVSAEILKKAIIAGSEKVQTLAQEVLAEHYADVAPKKIARTRAPSARAPSPDTKPTSEPERPSAAAENLLPAATVIQLEAPVPTKPKRRFASRLRELVLATGLAAVLGVVPSDTGKTHERGSSPKADATALKVPAEKTLERPDFDDLEGTEPKEKSPEQQQKEIEALSKHGLWGYVQAESRANGISRTEIIKRRTHAYPAGKSYSDLSATEKAHVYANYIDNHVQSLADRVAQEPRFGLILGGSDRQERLDDWQRTITKQKAQEIWDYLNPRF